MSERESTQHPVNSLLQACFHHCPTKFAVKVGETLQEVGNRRQVAFTWANPRREGSVVSGTCKLFSKPMSGTLTGCTFERRLLASNHTESVMSS
jgi:hypothetical protein